MNAPIDISVPAAVRGRIETVQFGAEFLVVEGWVADTSGAAPAESPQLRLAGHAHTIDGRFGRSDLESQGVSSDAVAFCVDFPIERKALPGGVVDLLVGGTTIERVSLSDPRCRSFRPHGALEVVSVEQLSGWLFDPGLWHGQDSGGVELIIGTYRLPIGLGLLRKDLAFSSARTGRPIGFQIHLLEAVAKSFGRDAATKLRALESIDIRLVTQGFQVASATLAMAAPPATPAPQPAQAPAVSVIPVPPTPPKPEFAGKIEYFAYSDELGGWLFGGWIDRASAAGVPRTIDARVDGRISGKSALLTHHRPEIGEIGLGLLGFVEAPAQPRPRFETLQIGTLRLKGADRIRVLGEAEAIEAMRTAACTPRGGAATPLGILLQRPVYKGGETLSKLGRPVHFETDELIAAPGAGAMLIGWFVDPTGQVDRIRVRSPEITSQPLSDRWVTTERPDIFDLLGTQLALQHKRWGFRAFADAPGLDLERAYVELTFKDGTIAFKPLPKPTLTGRAAIAQALGRVFVTSGNFAEAMSVMAPTAVAMKRAQIDALGEPAEIEIGPPPANPRASIIIPLYGRLDFLLYQMALFSEHDAGRDEYLYVLDDPIQRSRCVDLARSVHQRFGVPMRLLIMPENVGFGAASNAGLRAARGGHVCFLNSDVFPRTPDWIGLLSAALDANPKLGIVGARLLFEDGTIQHMGMALERKAMFGNMLFPVHPRKGRLPPAGDGLRQVPLVTGALMMMRRDLALDCGGFDPNYVIGDFEDADLCMRVREQGLDCAVHDGVMLYHLERQSQDTAATDWARNLTFVNAWTFNQRWGEAASQATGEIA